MFEKFFKKNNSSEICLDKLDVLDKLKERQMKADELREKQPQQIAIASCGCSTECSSDDCSHYGNTITFTAWARVPAGYNLVTAFPEFMYNTSCLKCLVESCTLPNISVVNPCDSTQTIEGCSVKLKKIRLLGCLKYYVDIGYAEGNPGGGFAYPGNEGVQCIDQIIRYTCDCETVCPETIGIDYSLSTGTPSPQPNGDTLVPINVTLTFTV
ncbi:MAG: hypothetical protein AB6733_19615 [Clostridiaceae bacterium]